MANIQDPNNNTYALCRHLHRRMLCIKVIGNAKLLLDNPIYAPQVEQKLFKRIRSKAKDHGLNQEKTLIFFDAVLTISKEIQAIIRYDLKPINPNNPKAQQIANNILSIIRHIIADIDNVLLATIAKLPIPELTGINAEQCLVIIPQDINFTNYQLLDNLAQSLKRLRTE